MAAELSRAAAAAVNPATWWNLLQNQFNQVAQSAISGAGLTVPAEAPPDGPKRRSSGAGAKAKGPSGRKPGGPAAKTAARRPSTRSKAER